MALITYCDVPSCKNESSKRDIQEAGESGWTVVTISVPAWGNHRFHFCPTCSSKLGFGTRNLSTKDTRTKLMDLFEEFLQEMIEISKEEGY